MIEEPFVEVYEVDLDFFYLHILIKKFHVDLRIFMGYIGLRKKGNSFKNDYRKCIIYNYVF
jgi:hypothetical protein